MKELDWQRSNFRNEVAGVKGDYWKNEALKKLWKCIEDVQNNEVIIESDGAIKWKCNNRYLMDDLVVVFEFATSRVNGEATNANRRIQQLKEIEEYRRAKEKHRYSAEEKHEMDAAFGPGHKIVDIFTGRTYTTR